MCLDAAAGILWRQRLHEHLAVAVRYETELQNADESSRVCQ